MYYFKSNDLDIYSGDEQEITIQVVGPDGSPIDLTGYTIKCRIQRNLQDSTPIIDWESCVITDADDGYCTIDVLSADTSTWEDGVYRMQLKLESSTETIYTYQKEFYVRPALRDE